MGSVGIRELQRNAAALLRRVEAGEDVEVTNQGRPIAVIVPLYSRQRRLPWMDAEEAQRRLRDLGSLGPDTTGWAQDLRAWRQSTPDPVVDPWEGADT
ncbi:MAG: type II toxin-antitoxin system prevent-host-death family antitoxin [Micrococcales bacterium]|nr:type II toxin-antitoxin system prevent-host-death family antitoxin [Micrococcales bacterium]